MISFGLCPNPEKLEKINLKQLMLINPKFQITISKQIPNHNIQTANKNTINGCFSFFNHTAFGN